MDLAIEVPMIVDWPATWSKWNMFNTCHWKFYLHEGSKFITGKAVIPFATNRAMQLGEQKHELYERAASSLQNGYKIPEALQQNPLWNPKIGEIISGLIGLYPNPVVEQKLGVDSTWRAWSLGEYWGPDKSLFGDRKMLFRAKFDFSVFNDSIWKEPTHGVIIDYKSGKVRKEEIGKQLALYALIAFCRWPSLQRVDCSYLFVDHNVRQDQIYYDHDVPGLKRLFAQRALGMQQYLLESSKQLPISDVNAGNCYWCAATMNQCIKSTKEV